MASTDDPITLTSLSGRRKRNIVQGEAKRIQVKGVMTTIRRLFTRLVLETEAACFPVDVVSPKQDRTPLSLKLSEIARRPTVENII
ncbi:uncharacterized protein ATNIH1004_011694 [Aspergillus tanneri]|uniref:Uncharacterized protein n=1 Tax=Aspergillus tanneri TaxID=1220188 RepID=A0A5M9M474_9EURO|nr:uncharacterized protein ATNIH1004_011694 [Aspergillus tanneri]KAA8641558.1 hypothetical protein ATNIH1004_011694 [Aspergillus tanneri]